MRRLMKMVEDGIVPDFLIREGIRRLNRERLEEEEGFSVEIQQARKEAFVADMNRSPVAPIPERANEQHYEVPSEFFKHVLGAHRKYSCCLFEPGQDDLSQAERASFNQIAQRAMLKDGQRVLELGCGWGSLSLWMAEKFPQSRITGVSNSSSQRESILERAKERGLANLEILTADMNQFDPGATFDRVVSIEMFEHMRNWRTLFERIRQWLNPDGRFFMHIFVHRCFPYLFEEESEEDWMGRYFFAGGMMPSDDLPLYFQDHLRCEHHWRLSGTHYQKTAEGWLRNIDQNQKTCRDVLVPVYGEDRVDTWIQRWRIFFMACSELWGSRQGKEWWVGHYLFKKQA